MYRGWSFLKTLVVVEPRGLRAVYPGGEVRSMGLREHVLPPLVALQVGQSEMEGVGHSDHVRGTGIPVNSRGKANGVEDGATNSFRSC